MKLNQSMNDFYIFDLDSLFGKIYIIALGFCSARSAFSCARSCGPTRAGGAFLGPVASLGLLVGSCSSARFTRARFRGLLVFRRFSLRIVASFGATFLVSILSVVASKSE